MIDARLAEGHLWHALGTRPLPVALCVYIVAMPPPEGFAYQLLSGEVHITHRGKKATVLRGEQADEFLAEVETGDLQEVAARITGNYRRGNERLARSHERNRNR